MAQNDQELREFLEKKYGVDAGASAKKETPKITNEQILPLWVVILIVFVSFSVINVFKTSVFSIEGIAFSIAFVAGAFAPFWIFRIVAQFIKQKENYDKQIDNLLLNVLIMIGLGIFGIIL